MSETLLKQAFDAAQPALAEEISKAKTTFMSAFGDWIGSVHQARLEELFMSAGKAKLKSLFAATKEEAESWQDIFETFVDSLETIGLADWITAKASAMKAIKTTMTQILHGLAVGFGIAVKTIMGLALPGIGALGGAVAGPGITLLLDHLFGSGS